jgi:hypothetical protein
MHAWAFDHVSALPQYCRYMCFLEHAQKGHKLHQKYNVDYFSDKTAAKLSTLLSDNIALTGYADCRRGLLSRVQKKREVRVRNTQHFEGQRTGLVESRQRG